MRSFHARDGASIAYRDNVHGETTLLLLHGWLADGSVWTPLRHILEKRYRVVTVDLRGMGASNAAPGPYHIETFSSDLIDLVRTLNLSPLVVIGHSSGGMLAQRLAIDAPAAVKALVLIAPVPASGWTFTSAVNAFMRDITADQEKTKYWLAGLFATAPTPEKLRLLQAAAATVSLNAACESYASWTGANFAAQAATIQAPTLIIAPEHDRPMTPSVLKEKVADVLPNARLSVLAGAAHYAQLDLPADVAALIHAFIRDSI